MLNLLRQKSKYQFKYHLLLVLLFSCLGLTAQINNPDFRVNLNSGDMGPCGGSNDAGSTVGVLSKSNTVNDFQIAFDLPDGVFYVPGSARITLQEGSSDYTLSVVDITDLNAPVFRLERPGDANWVVADRVRIRFRKTASCEAVQFSYAGGLFKDAHTITYQENGVAQTDSDTDATINSYELLRAFLAVLNYDDVNATNGQSISRTLDITNSGNGNVSTFEHLVNVGSELSGYELVFNGNVLTPTAISGTNRTYTFDLSQAPFAGNVGNGNDTFENETITLSENFTVVGCGDTNVSHQPTWGCSSTEICQQLAPVVGQVLLNTEVPNIRAFEVGNSNFAELSTVNNYEYRIENTATVPAFDVALNIGFANGGDITTASVNPLVGNDHPADFGKAYSNIRIQGTAANPEIRPTTTTINSGSGSYFIPPNHFTVDPDGAGVGFEDLDGDGFFDDLAAGDETLLSYDITFNPVNRACGGGGAVYIGSRRQMIDAYAQNQCGVYSGSSRNAGDSNILRRDSPFTNAPTDIFDATSFNVTINPRMSLNNAGRLRCNSIDLFSNDPTTTMTVTLNVPEGVVLDGSPAGFTQISPTEIEFTTDQLESASGDFQILNVGADFPLLMNCATYTGGPTVDFTYTTTFSSPCFTQETHCGTISGVRAQCTGNCDGVAVTSFDAERISLGWTDNSMATPITPDPVLHELDTYMQTDEMRLQTSARFNNVNTDNLFFDLSYTTESTFAGLANVLEFLNGSIEINDISSGVQSVAIDANDITVSSSGLDHRLRIDLSSYRSIISPSYTYGEASGIPPVPEPDEINLELIFRVDNIPGFSELFELENFSGRFFYNDITGNPVFCNALGDRVSYFRPRIDPIIPNNENFTDCREARAEFPLRLLALDNIDPFPNEYRRAHSLSSISIDIPTDMIFTGSVESYLVSGGPNSFDVTQSGNTITITPNADFRYVDVSDFRYPTFRVYFQATNATMPVSSGDYSLNATAFPDSNVPFSLDRTGAIQYNYTEPEVTISSIEPVVIASNAGATFEVDYCLRSSTDIDFNWLRIANGSEFTITNAYEVTGTGDVPLNFTFGTGETYVELGQLENGFPVCKKIRFETNYSACNAIDFNVDSSWSCSGYPANFETEPYSNAYTMRLEPQNAVLQFTILDEPSGSVDMCSNFNIDLEVRNAGNGNLINPTVSLDIPGDASSLSFNDILIEYPRGSTPQSITSYTVVGNTLTIDLAGDTDVVANNGLMGAINANNINDQIAIVQLNMSVACSFVSSTAITFEANGENPCASVATGDGSRLSTNPLIVTGAEPFYDAISTVNIPNGGTFTGCSTETISVESTIVGGPTGSTDFARIILPDGLTMDQTSFNSTSAFAATFNAINTVDNHEEILLDMPSGANNGEIIMYSFDVAPKNTETTCTPDARIEIFNFVTFNSLSCGATFCSAYEVPVGDTFENVAILKPELIESAFTSNADYTTHETGNFEYHVEFGIENTGSVDIASDFVYDVYCADAAGVRFGASIYTGTINQVIPAGNSITEDIFFTTSTFCGDASNMIVEFVPSDTNCHCDALAIPLISEPEVADLELTNSVNIVNANPGDAVTFAIEVLNNGPFDAQNIGVENLLPAGYSITSIANGGTQSGNIIAWPQFDLSSGDTLTFTFTATVNTPTGSVGEYDNISEVVAVDEYDSDSTPDNYDGLPLEDDEAIVSVAILTADLSLNKAPNAATGPDYNTGDTLTFEITLNNNGPDQANNVSIEDVVPIGFTVGTINNGGVLAGNTITWDIANVPVGNQILSYEVSLNESTNTVAEYTNIAQVTASDQFDPNSTPNNDDGDQSEDDEANYTINPPVTDLEITKTVDRSESVVGQTVVFTVGVTNVGLVTATNIGIEDILPQGFELISTTTDNGGYEENTGVWAIDSLEPGLTALLEMSATVTEIEDYTNIAQLIYLDQIDNNIDNDRAEVTVEVTQECLVVFNEFSPNNDGANEFFFIECIEDYPNNTVQIFNRWGIKVFEQQAYNNTWNGTSKGRATTNANEKLPVGTYYYVLEPGDGQTPPKSGWLYITR